MFCLFYAEKNFTSLYSYSKPSKSEAEQVPGNPSRTRKVPSSVFHQVVTTAELNGTGSYYIGVRFLPIPSEYRSLYGRDPDLKYSLRMWETQCKVWNDGLNMYSTKGCKVCTQTIKDLEY